MEIDFRPFFAIPMIEYHYWVFAFSRNHDNNLSVVKSPSCPVSQKQLTFFRNHWKMVLQMMATDLEIMKWTFYSDGDWFGVSLTHQFIYVN